MITWACSVWSKCVAAAADPLLGFEQQVRELRADLLRQEFQQSHAKQQIDLDIFFIFGLLKPGVKKIGKLPFPGRTLRERARPCGRIRGAWICRRFSLHAVGLRKKRKIRVLADEFQQVSLGCLDETRGSEKHHDECYPRRRPECREEAPPNRASG